MFFLLKTILPNCKTNIIGLFKGLHTRVLNLTMVLWQFWQSQRFDYLLKTLDNSSYLVIIFLRLYNKYFLKKTCASHLKIIASNQEITLFPRGILIPCQTTESFLDCSSKEWPTRIYSWETWLLKVVYVHGHARKMLPNFAHDYGPSLNLFAICRW